MRKIHLKFENQNIRLKIRPHLSAFLYLTCFNDIPTYLFLIAYVFVTQSLYLVYFYDIGIKVKCYHETRLTHFIEYCSLHYNYILLISLELSGLY